MTDAASHAGLPRLPERPGERLLNADELAGWHALLQGFEDSYLPVQSEAPEDPF